jgi:CDP-paratose 2-epimerase
MTRVLITGGAGFVGSSLALHLRRLRTNVEITAFDNLHRRGSELALPRLKAHGIRFVHGDIRQRDDLDAAGPFDVMIECSAEPSVHAGYASDPSYVVGTNLIGTTVCLDAVRRHGAGILFLSTSRVYPIAGMRALPLEEAATRLRLRDGETGIGWSGDGIATNFPLTGARSLYGATKLASELIIEEYRQMYDLPAIVTRCGVIAGPWQMGKVDQGFITLWAARHLWGDGLSYSGFGGRGLQVRDVLHVDDLGTLVNLQVTHLAAWSGQVLNAGGGSDRSISLLELTEACGARAGRTIPMGCRRETAPADIPYYVSDNREVSAATGWTPQHSVNILLDDVFGWLRAGERDLRPLLVQV